MRFDVTRERATYSCPWPKTGVRRSSPTYFTDWPSALFIVSANASRTGN